MRSWLLVWVALFGLALVLAGSVAPQEVVGAAMAAAIAAVAWQVVRTRDDARFVFRGHDFLVLARRLPLHVIADCGRVLGVLPALVRGEQVHGRMGHLPFDPGAADDPLAAARRALVVASVSVAPNSLAIRVEQGSLLIHQLVPVDEPVPDPEFPV